jgi:hypothetical protein
VQPSHAVLVGDMWQLVCPAVEGYRDSMHILGWVLTDADHRVTHMSVGRLAHNLQL